MSEERQEERRRYERFGSLLTKERRAAGLSQTEVAERLGRPQTYVSKSERGTRRMDVIEFLEMAVVVGFDACSFLDRLRQSANEAEDGY